MLVLDPEAAREFPVTRYGIRAVPLRGGRWRVTRAHGEVLGYVDAVDATDGPRWRSSRLNPRTAAFVPLGEFRDAADALDVVRG